ncbi:REP-associated tyrosine transposase [Pseudomonas sp. NPDC090201]|uniref:REP-associated tyrosine transposase n=1 Tax=Pseudomonas sp. NPDC090201 TaxID=3364475 RepID=UPI00380A43BF
MTGKSKSHRLRTGRFSAVGGMYLVTSRLESHRQDFADLRLGRLLVQEMREAEALGLIESLAWVVMPDHFHWLVELATGSLPDIVRRVKSRTAIAVNKVTGRQGRIWQPGYHDIAVRYEDDLIHFARYIVANPLRAGLVRRIGDYPLWDAVWLPEGD